MQPEDFVGKRVKLKCILRTKNDVMLDYGHILKCNSYKHGKFSLWDEERKKLIVGVPIRCIELAID